MINLVKDTINNQDIDALIAWLKTYPRLTKGKLTEQFEQKWSNWLDIKYSVFVNSGSAANLAMLYSMVASGRIKNNKVIVPTISWATTVAPVIQLRLSPLLCEADKVTLGLDLNHFEKLCKKHNPSAAVVVPILGIPPEMDKLIYLCEKYGVFLLEDACESVGSLYEEKKIGTFGVASTFSFYFGHHLSTIEGGMICTDDKVLYDVLKSIRSHGWDRDLDIEKQQSLRKFSNVDDFRALYTFYYPGFNLRSTDLQAFLGIHQIDKVEVICKKREENLKLYTSLIKNNYWKLSLNSKCFISNFAYPIIHPKIKEIVCLLNKNNIECRPLVCGSIGRQPFWIKEFEEQRFPFADIVHDYGLYVPNNPSLTAEEIELICRTINEVTAD